MGFPSISSPDCFSDIYRFHFADQGKNFFFFGGGEGGRRVDGAFISVNICFMSDREKMCAYECRL